MKIKVLNGTRLKLVSENEFYSHFVISIWNACVDTCFNIKRV